MATIAVMGLVFQILIWAGKSQRFKGYAEFIVYIMAILSDTDFLYSEHEIT